MLCLLNIRPRKRILLQSKEGGGNQNLNTMALIKSVRGFTPKMGNNCYLADNATIIGDVVMGDDCSVWFGAVLRGDVNSIRIGNRVNIQDNSTVHTTFEDSVAEIGDDVTIGHNVVIHGARIEPNALIGIGSILLDHVVVGSNTLVAAGSVVLERTILEPNSLYAGTPAKRIKTIDPQRLESMIRRIAKDYVMYAGWYKE
jgi:carbonic anhydrase/acetyltransferase-like protein (isoleucine patch superfamily)